MGKTIGRGPEQDVGPNDDDFLSLGRSEVRREGPCQWIAAPLGRRITAPYSAVEEGSANIDCSIL